MRLMWSGCLAGVRLMWRGGRAGKQQCTARSATIRNAARGDRVSLVVVVSLQNMFETTITPFRSHEQITPKSHYGFTSIHTEPYVRYPAALSSVQKVRGPAVCYLFSVSRIRFTASCFLKSLDVMSAMYWRSSRCVSLYTAFCWADLVRHWWAGRSGVVACRMPNSELPLVSWQFRLRGLLNRQ